MLIGQNGPVFGSSNPYSQTGETQINQGIPIYNVSVVDESYRLVNAPTVIDLPDL